MQLSDPESARILVNILDRISTIESTLLELSVTAAKMQSDLRQQQTLVDSVTTSTAGIIDIYTNLMGFSKVGIAVHAFLRWLVSWGIVGGAIAALIKWTLGQGGPPGIEE